MVLSEVVAPLQSRKTGRRVWTFGSVTMMLNEAARALITAGAAKDGALVRLVNVQILIMMRASWRWP